MPTVQPSLPCASWGASDGLHRRMERRPRQLLPHVLLVGADPVTAAARLRSLAALFDQPLNRDQEHTFTGHALAEMLRGEG